MAIILLAAAAAVTAAQLHIVAEPPWLRRMNELEHFVLHTAFWLAGVTLGSIALAALAWSALRLSAPLRKQIVEPSSGRDRRRSRLRPRNLVLSGLFLLGATATLLAAQHGALPQPAWLAGVSPFQHFLVHLGYILSGVLVALAGLSAWGRSLLDLLVREWSWNARNAEALRRRDGRHRPGSAHGGAPGGS